MKIRIVLALVLTACLTPGLAAQQPQPKTLSATGRVVAVTQDSITIQPAEDLTISVDATTRVVGKGVGTKTRTLKAEGRAPTITDLVDVSDSVTVKYAVTQGGRHAKEIRIHVKTFRKH